MTTKTARAQAVAARAVRAPGYDIAAATTVSFRGGPAPGYRRPGWRLAIAEYLPLAWRGARAERWIGQLPIIGVLAVYAMLVLLLDNTAYSDEVALVQAGRDQLAQGFGGMAVEPIPHRGAMSIYPVLAALLDAVGGLELVRLLSLVAMLASVRLLAATVAGATSSGRTGLLAGAGVALAAASVYAGALGTADALCLLALAVAVWAGSVGQSLRSGLACGGALGLAVSMEYVALLFVPAVVLLVVLLRRWRGLDSELFRLQVAPFAALTLTGLLAGFVTLRGDSLREVVDATITSAAALRSLGSAEDWTALAWLGLDLGLVGVLGVAGAAFAPRGTRLLSAGVVGAGSIIPAAAMWASETTSVNRLSAYAALFLAPLAGLALARLTRMLLRWVPVVAVLLVSLVLAGSQSQMMVNGWVDVRPALSYVARTDSPGRYLSTAADTLRYYTQSENPGPTWESTATLASRGPTAVRESIEQRRYAVVLLQPTTASDPVRDGLLEALNRSADYVAEQPLPDADDPSGQWTVYRLLNTLP